MYKVTVKQTCNLLGNFLTGKNAEYDKKTFDMVNDLYSSTMGGSTLLEQEAGYSEKSRKPIPDQSSGEEDEQFLRFVGNKVERYLIRKNNEAAIWKRKYEDSLKRHQTLLEKNLKHQEDITKLHRKMKVCHQTKLENQQHVLTLNSTLQMVSEERNSHREEANKMREDLNDVKADHSACQFKVMDANNLFKQMNGASENPSDQDSSLNGELEDNLESSGLQLEWKQTVSDVKRNMAAKQNSVNSLQNSVTELNSENSQLQMEIQKQSGELEISRACLRNLTELRELYDATVGNSELLSEQIKAAMHYVQASDERKGEAKLDECLSRKLFVSTLKLSVF